MSRSLVFSVPGRPQAWERTQGSGHRRYKAGNTAAAQQHVAFRARAAMGMQGFERIEGPVRLWVRAVFKRPNKRPRKVSAEDWATRDSLVRPCIPDADNLVKLVSDALNGITFKDDAQVVDERVWTEWGVEGEEPGLHILVEPVRSQPARYRAEIWRQSLNAFVPTMITPWQREAEAHGRASGLPWLVVHHTSGEVVAQSVHEPLEASP